MIYLVLLSILYVITTGIAYYTTDNINRDIIEQISDDYYIKSSFYIKKDNYSISYLNKRLRASFIPLIHFYVISYNMEDYNYDKLYRNVKRKLLKKGRIVLKNNSRNLENSRSLLDVISEFNKEDVVILNNSKKDKNQMSVEKFETEFNLSNIYTLNETTYLYAKYLLYVYKRDKSRVDTSSVLGKAEIIILEKYIRELEKLIKNYEINNIDGVMKKTLNNRNNQEFHK